MAYVSNSQYLSKGQFTIPNISNSQNNISKNKKIKLKLDISPLNNESHEIKKSNIMKIYYPTPPPTLIIIIIKIN